MTSLALAAPSPRPVAHDHFAIVTIFGGEAPAPAWERMFGWPAHSDTAVPLAAAADRRIWASKLDRVVRDADRAVLLIADGVGCAASAWWARLSPADYVGRIAGALLFPGEAAQAPDDRFDSPHTRLPFPSLVIRPGEPTLPPAIATWGGRVITPARVRQRDSGTAAWRNAQRLFLRLTSQVVEHDVRLAEKLVGGR